MRDENQKCSSSVQMENVGDLDIDESDVKPADYETAVAATGYGKFHYLLLLSVFLPCWGSSLDTGNTSLILPSAECDLELTLFDKGMLNAGEFSGMVTSAMIWGFCADTYGRKKLLIFGFFADALCNIMSGLAQSFWVLLFFKFLSGCIINGPYAIVMTYCAEFQSNEHRARTMVLLGLYGGVGTAIVPILGWLIIPGSWRIVLFDGAFVFNSWHLFLTVCGLPTLIGTLALIKFPESPKFLIFQGKHAEALGVFRKMYAMNTGKPPNEYPVTLLEGQLKSGQSEDSAASALSEEAKNPPSLWKDIRDGLKQVKPLFHMPYLRNLLLIIVMQFNGMLSMNTIRLWLPQLFAILDNFDNIEHVGLGSDATLCEKIDFSTESSENMSFVEELVNGTTVLLPHHCENFGVDATVYLNTIFISIASICMFIFAGFVVNILGKKNMLLISYTVALVCVVSLNWSSNAVMTLVLSSLYVSLTLVSVNTLIAVTVDAFPTSLSTMAVSLIMMMGRAGSLTGNIMFSILLSVGCIAPFMAISGTVLICLTLSYFIPKPAEARPSEVKAED